MWTVLFAFVIVQLCLTVQMCPDGCRCTMLRTRKERSKDLGHKVSCGLLDFTSLDKIDVSQIPNDTTHFVISGTKITKLPANSFLLLPHLIKLDLSNNSILSIDDQAFSNLALLEKLDLSNNSLNILSKDVLRSLTSLQKIDLRDNPLICDCHLSWIVEWSKKSKVRITPRSTCEFPAQLRGASLAKMSKKDMHCDWNFQLPVFELRPTASQLAFEGDPILFLCRVSDIHRETKLLWSVDGQLLSQDDQQVIITHSSSDGILTSSLSVDRLYVNHSGSWMCHVSTSRGNLSRTVDVVVIAENAPSCPEAVTWGNKGQYHWPQTLAGITVTVACSGSPPVGLEFQLAKAYHSCSSEGTWHKLDTSSCPFVSETTKVLEQFAKSNLTQSTTVVETARGLRNYTGNGSMLSDYMDLVFIAQTLENYLVYVPQHKELAEILVDVISVVLRVDKRLLITAQEQDRTCSKLVVLIERLSNILADTEISRYHENLIVEEFLDKPEIFPGMRCTSYQTSSASKNLQCIRVNRTLLLNLDKPVEASIFVPYSVALPVAPLQPPLPSKNKLQFVLFRNSVVFPRPHGLGQDRDVTSVVISCITVPMRNQSLLHPVEVTLRLPVYTSDASPARWDPLAADGRGDWVTEGCKVSSVHDQLVSFVCNRLGIYGVLQDLATMRSELRYHQAQFRLSHVTVYIGSLLCSGFLLLSIVAFFREWKNILMPKTMKHSLVNTWVAMLLLCVVFTLGIPQTDLSFICQSVGLIIHYLTLSTLIWMIISVNNLYKHLCRHEVPDLPPDEPPPDPNVPPKPILRFYFVGWGIGTIVCGISAAVHLEGYSNQQFCFLSTTSSLAAFYGPVIVTLIFLVMYFLLILCQLNQETESSGILLVNSPTTTFTDTNSIIDMEFPAAAQLRSHFIVLLLFLVSFSLAVLYIVRPFFRKLSFNSLIYGLSYCVSSCLLGGFIFAFFCYSRRELRRSFCLAIDDKIETSNSIVVDEVNADVPNKDNSLSVVDDKDTSSSGPVEKLTNVLAYMPRDKELDKSCSVNLLSTHCAAPPPPESSTASNLELFYNPRQSIVAKRFFEKNRRQQQLKAMHKNNLQKAHGIDSTYMRARAYSDTEKASSTQGSSGRDKHSHLCTSQSYNGACNMNCSYNPTGAAATAESRKTAVTVQNGLIEVHVEPTSVKSSPIHSSAKHPHGDAFNRDSHWLNSGAAVLRKPVRLGCGRSSCSECTICSRQRQPSVCSQSGVSDFTSVSQGAAKKQRSRSGSGRNRWRKNSRQYSWDDKYDNAAGKVFVQPSPSSPVVMDSVDCQSSVRSSRRKHRRRSESRNSDKGSSCAARPSRRHIVSRSQSAYEQVKNDPVAGSDDGLEKSNVHKETCM